MEYKNLIVYQKALEVKSQIEFKVLSTKELNKSIKDQLQRASQSIVLNIAEGSSRFSPADRKNFFVIARGSAFECSAALDIIEASGGGEFNEVKGLIEEISKILFKMISTLNEKIESSRIKSK
jgi:four helix bundle protein